MIKLKYLANIFPWKRQEGRQKESARVTEGDRDIFVVLAQCVLLLVQALSLPLRHFQPQPTLYSSTALSLSLPHSPSFCVSLSLSSFDRWQMGIMNKNDRNAASNACLHFVPQGGSNFLHFATIFCATERDRDTQRGREREGEVAGGGLTRRGQRQKLIA